MGEGGAISINNPNMIDRGAVVREKGTNRTQFLNGQVDKYTWVDKGSSYLPSDILAAYLYPQLLKIEEIKDDRVKSFEHYMDKLLPLKRKGYVDLPYIPDACEQNGHMFYILVKDLSEREKLQHFLREKNIITAFHYIPLHSAPEGLKVGRFVGEDEYTTNTYERLLRLPMYYKLSREEIDTVCKAIYEFYGE